LTGVDIRLHRFGHVEHEHDINRTALADAAKIQNLGFLAILENFDVIGTKVADRIAVLIGETEVKLDAAVGVEMLEARITGGDFQARVGRRDSKNETKQKNERKQATAGVSIRRFHRRQVVILRIRKAISQAP